MNRSGRRQVRWTTIACNVAAAALVAGCSGGGDPSMSQRVSDQEHVSADCVKVGVMELAAERTRVWRCRWDLAPLSPGQFTAPCYADVDGDLDDITDQAYQAGFDCSHAAQVADQ